MGGEEGREIAAAGAGEETVELSTQLRRLLAPVPKRRVERGGGELELTEVGLDAVLTGQRAVDLDLERGRAVGGRGERGNPVRVGAAVGLELVGRGRPGPDSGGRQAGGEVAHHHVAQVLVGLRVVEGLLGGLLRDGVGAPGSGLALSGWSAEPHTGQQAPTASAPAISAAIPSIRACRSASSCSWRPSAASRTSSHCARADSSSTVTVTTSAAARPGRRARRAGP
ncbi:hypothetical protein [Nocardioides ungokensis]|uniref:hypothetical protein n=1 Tax=Nocardioides ungokensis TaxID=1643322 RepID=UPI0015E031D3|nr:hypothetical protein [Nocardioides ungokensis]